MAVEYCDASNDTINFIWKLLPLIEVLKIIEQLELLHKMLKVDNPKDDDPAKILTRGKIRELIKKYQQEVEEFEKWAAETQD